MFLLLLNIEYFIPRKIQKSKASHIRKNISLIIAASSTELQTTSIQGIFVLSFGDVFKKLKRHPNSDPEGCSCGFPLLAENSV
jgi:hypothetical protein